jgi:hypothetical protein
LTAPRKDYGRDEAAVRGAWFASTGTPTAQTEDEIRARAGCSSAVAYRVACLRRAGSMRTIGLWLGGALTLRQVERIVTTAPFDEDRQLEEARETSPTARALLARPTNGAG